ncbi:MAG: Uma2 family endonuclease [Thermoanaerobaculia bacterium]|nr:Uma2 family endonuclease [Thermoanaerobaculia bacterium]
MTAAASKSILPYTYADRLALEGEIRVSATLEEYLEFAEQCEYRVEYSNGQIISMGHPTDTHEQICSNVSWVFNNLFTDVEPFIVYGSNLGIFIPASGVYYKPDAVVSDRLPEYIFHKVGKKTLKSVLNPYAAIEVFSDSTMDYDLTEKLPNYKQCPYLKYIIYIHQHKPFVTVYTRTDDPTGWLNHDYVGLQAEFSFEGRRVSVRQLYRKVIFAERPPHPAR